MGVWGTIGLAVVCVTAFILLLATAANLFISWSARQYSGKTLNKTLTELEQMLPGKNCGACGCATCKEYAHGVFSYKMETDRCPEGGPELPQKLDAYMEAFQKLLINDTPKKQDMYNR